MEFNPIKETVDGKKAHNMVWTTEVLKVALKGLEAGKKLVANPFYENNTKLLKGDLVFKRTDEEIKEWVTCKNDIIYFANKYCKLMTPQGIKNVEMRDYQEDYLNHLMKNRLSIFLSCRQSGKCLLFLSKINVKICQQVKNKSIIDYYIKDDEYELPLFELYNLYDSSLKWKIEYRLYKFLYKLTCRKEKQRQKTLGKE